MTAGATSAVRSAHSPIRMSPTSPRRERRGADVRPWSTATRVLTNQPGTRITGVEYYDQKKEHQVQEASRASRLGGAESADSPQFGNRQASQGVCQFERPRRQIH